MNILVFPGNDKTSYKIIHTIELLHTMKYKYSLLLLLTPFICFAQPDVCATCTPLDTADLNNEHYKDYQILCFKKDSIALPNNAYQITLHHRCKTYKEVTQYNLKAENLVGYVVEETDTIYNHTDTPAEFKGSNAEKNKILSRNVRYPREAEKKGIEGRVSVSAFVDKNGKIYRLKLKEKSHPALDQETLRVFALFPDFIPARHQGLLVNFIMTLSISYKLPE